VLTVSVTVYIPHVFSPLHITGLQYSATVQLAFPTHRMISGLQAYNTYLL